MPGITYSINFAAAIARLEENTRKGAKSVRDMAGQMESASNFARNALLGLAGALGVHSFSEWVRGASEAADAAAKVSDRFGIATQAVIGQQHAVQLAGGTAQDYSTAMRTMAYQATLAAMGLGQSKRAFDLLNIDAKDFLKLPMDQQFRIMIERLHDTSNAAVRNAVSQQIFQGAAESMLGVVADGVGTLDDATKKTEAWGLAISRIDAAKLEMANDAMTNAKAAANGVATTIALQLAPVIKTLADYWSDTAAEEKGFRDNAVKGSGYVAEAIGYVANFVQGLRAAWKAAELAVAGFFDLALNGFRTLAQYLANSPVVRFMTYLPGPIGAAAKAFQDFANSGTSSLNLLVDTMDQRVKDIKAELDAIALEGLPHDQIVARIAAIKAEMDKAAVEIAKKRHELNRNLPTVPTGIAVDELKFKQDLAKRVGQILLQNQTEYQGLENQLLEKRNVLEEAHNAGLIDEQTYRDELYRINLKFQNDVTKLEDDQAKERYGIANVYRRLDLQSSSYFFGQIGALMETKSRTLFNIGKAGAIAQTVIDTYRAAQGAYAALAGIPIVGPGLGIAAAAAAIATGLARVQQIRSTQFGGGAAATAVFSANPATGVPTSPIGQRAGSSPIAPPSQAQATPPKQDVNITLIGKSFDYDTIVNELIPQINQAAGNGVNIQVSAV